MSANGTANGHASHVAAPVIASEDEATSTGEPKKPFKPEWPLVSWADTKQNISAISFVLGCVFTLAMSTGIKAFSQFEVPTDRKDRFWAAITGPRLGIYVALLVVFHMLEFLVTAIYNPKKVTARSFLLEDKNHNAAHMFALCEFLLEETFLPLKWLAWKRSPYLAFAGLVVVFAGQYLRSLAMITAASNFSHLVQFSKAPEHSLVRTGIYSWSRHPSYVAFFYWALGTQIFIGNPVSLVVFSLILYTFFSNRIKVEEWYLVKFFGPDYVKYQKEVPARIPFIP